MPCRFDHRAPLEARGTLPAEKRATSDTRGPRLLQRRVVGLALEGSGFDLARGLADRPGASDDRASPVPTARRLRGRIEAAARGVPFDTRTARPRGMAGRGA